MWLWDRTGGQLIKYWNIPSIVCVEAILFLFNRDFGDDECRKPAVLVLISSAQSIQITIIQSFCMCVCVLLSTRKVQKGHQINVNFLRIDTKSKKSSLQFLTSTTDRRAENRHRLHWSMTRSNSLGDMVYSSPQQTNWGTRARYSYITHVWHVAMGRTRACSHTHFALDFSILLITTTSIRMELCNTRTHSHIFGGVKNLKQRSCVCVPSNRISLAAKLTQCTVHCAVDYHCVFVCCSVDEEIKKRRIVQKGNDTPQRNAGTTPSPYSQHILLSVDLFQFI